MILFNGCKINLGLDVLSRRYDRFHEVATVMYPVPTLCDSVEIVLACEPKFTQSGLKIDCTAEKNIVLRAVKLLSSRFGKLHNQALHIHLHKAIPFGAGLGGGSSDGAAALIILNSLFDLGLTPPELERFAAELGSDVPFFIRNTPQFCTGRGEIMTPCCVSLNGYRIVVVKPDINISTAGAYAGITPHLPSTPLSERILRPISEWRECLFNAFEPSVFALHPQLAAIKQQLYDAGAVYASMSGSGSALFGVFPIGADINSDLNDCLTHSTPAY